MTGAGAVSGGQGSRGVTGAVRISAVADGRGCTVLPLLAGEGALAVRRTRSGTRDREAAGPASRPEAHPAPRPADRPALHPVVRPGTHAPNGVGTQAAMRAGTQFVPAHPGAAVMLVGAMSAPLGGDRLQVDITVGAGARLAVGSAAATVALPGSCGQPAWYDVRLTVAEGGELHWLTEPVIAAAGSDLRMTTRVDLAPGARLVLREELVLGRHGEAPGRLGTRLTVTADGRPLLDQDLCVGPGAPPGWDGPAGLAGHRAVGQLLVTGIGTATGFGTGTDSDFGTGTGTGTGAATGRPYLLTGPADSVQAVATPLATGAATLITALAPDARQLRPLLARTLEDLRRDDPPTPMTTPTSTAPPDAAGVAPAGSRDVVVG